HVGAILSVLLEPVPPASTLLPYTTLFRSWHRWPARSGPGRPGPATAWCPAPRARRIRRSYRVSGRSRASGGIGIDQGDQLGQGRSEEHTSELQSRFDIVCRLLREKKKNHI